MSQSDKKQTVHYKIEVDCANCAAKMETASAKIPGVESVSVAFLMGRMTVTFAPGAEPKKVMKAVLKVCRRIEPDCDIQF